MNTVVWNRTLYVRLFLLFLLDSARRILIRALITAGILATLALVYWSHRPLDGKISDCLLVLIAAALYLMYCGNIGLPSFTEFRQRIAQNTKQARIPVELARRDRNAGVRAEAAKRLTDQTMLERIARNDENLAVRASAARSLASPDALLDIVAASNDLSMWRLCFPALISSLLADETYRQRVYTEARNSPFAEELLRQSTCTYCHGWVETEIRESVQWPDDDLYEPVKKKQEPKQIWISVFCCRNCKREDTVGSWVPFAACLAEGGLENAER